MKSQISKVNIEMSIEEIQMLAQETHYLIFSIENDSKTDLEIVMLKKLHEHLLNCIAENTIGETVTGFKLKPNA